MTDLDKPLETPITNALWEVKYRNGQIFSWTAPISRRKLDAMRSIEIELDQLRAENATLRAAQKACEHCDSGIATVVEEGAREIAKSMPSGMIEMSSADYWTAQINAAITLAVQQERDRCMAELAECRKDVERYRWLRSASVDRGNDFPNKWWEKLGDSLDDDFDAAIDAASAEGGGKLAKLEKFASGDENRNI